MANQKALLVEAAEVVGVARPVSFASGSTDFITYAPLKRGQTDESRNAVSPKYLQGGNGFLSIMRAIADTLDSSGDVIETLGRASRRTEEGVTGLSRWLPRL